MRALIYTNLHFSFAYLQILYENGSISPMFFTVLVDLVICAAQMITVLVDLYLHLFPTLNSKDTDGIDFLSPACPPIYFSLVRNLWLLQHARHIPLSEPSHFSFPVCGNPSPSVELTFTSSKSFLKCHLSKPHSLPHFSN